MSSDLKGLKNDFHSLCVSWYNFHALHVLATEVMAKTSPFLQLEDWKSYLARFKEFCLAQNLKDFSDVFFRVEECNIFMIELDKSFDKLTLTDIGDIHESLSNALGCPSVCIHLVTVREISRMIYFYYCLTDYLTFFQSLSIEHLKMVSEIGHNDYNILSLSDFHCKFKYDNIQRLAVASAENLKDKKIILG